VSDKESAQRDDDVRGHLGKAIRHAEDAVRCWLSLIANRSAKIGSAIARAIVLALVLTVVALVGLIFAAYGLAKWLENGLGLTPGVGVLCVGVAMLCAVAVCAIALRKGNGDES